MPLFVMISASMNTEPAPLPPLPSKRQMAWQKIAYYAFVHFGPNTFTGNEWGTGQESEHLFHPTHLDCLQWCKAFKAAGMTGVVITAKHHDGFCLWPSKFSKHTVAQSPWKGGRGDVLRELSDACHKTGLKFGVYLSPWDRNHPAYGTPEYNHVFESMLGEVLHNYGLVFEVWFDGANGEGPNGKKQVYDWPGFVQTVRRLQPNACMFSDAGPDVRWIGNENGYADETNWSFINRDEFYPGTPNSGPLTKGNPDGRDWVGAECDVSIRPGWFYRPSEDSQVKTPDQLEDIWYASVGSNANLILNVPPGQDGLIHPEDIKSLMGLRQKLDNAFASNLAPLAQVSATNSRGKDFSPSRAVSGSGYWVTEDGVVAASLTLRFASPQQVSRVWLEEEISKGQRVKKFSVEGFVGGGWTTLAEGTTIGARRILRFSPVQASQIRVNILDARACPCIRRVGVY